MTGMDEIARSTADNGGVVREMRMEEKGEVTSAKNKATMSDSLEIEDLL